MADGGEAAAVLVISVQGAVEFGQVNSLLRECWRSVADAYSVYACCCCHRRVLVLDQGMLVESGEPHVLLQHDSGIFSGMVAQTGPNSSTHLKEVARAASINRLASRTAVQLHDQQLRMQSEVLGRRYLDLPVLDAQLLQQQAGQQAERAEESPYMRMDSSRFGVQVRGRQRDVSSACCACA